MQPDGFDRLVPCTVQGHDVHYLVQGVETDADGMVVAYWVCDRHPLASNAYTSGGPHWTRVEAYTKTTGRRNVLHVMNRGAGRTAARCAHAGPGAGSPETVGPLHGRRNHGGGA